MNNYFLNTISQLRNTQELIIYNFKLKTTSKEDNALIPYLESEYDNEKVSYPFKAPHFDAEAALWGAKTVYFSAQLILQRQDTSKELQKLFANEPGNVNPSSILSVDLCLRFLPDLYKELKNIDPLDTLLNLLAPIMEKWHYSAIGLTMSHENLNFECFLANPTVKQLYLDRIIQEKATDWAEFPQVNTIINANLGFYKKYFWPELQIQKQDTTA